MSITFLLTCNSTLQISNISPSMAACPRLKTLRLEENCLAIAGIPEELLMDSQVSLLCVDGNLFKMKEFEEVPGYSKVGRISLAFFSPFEINVIFSPFKIGVSSYCFSFSVYIKITWFLSPLLYRYSSPCLPCFSFFSSSLSLISHA